LQDLKASRTDLLFIAHDLAVIRPCLTGWRDVSRPSVETAPAEALYARPLHPYKTVAAALGACAGSQGGGRRGNWRAATEVTTRRPPRRLPVQCALPLAQFPICAEKEPTLAPRSGDHSVACHFA